jgi:hypothetical protein
LHPTLPGVIPKSIENSPRRSSRRCASLPAGRA